MKALPLAVVCLALMAGAADAHASTITFGTNNDVQYESLGTTYTESGYKFVNDLELGRWPNDSVYDSDPTSSTGVFTNYHGTSTVLTRVDGTPFDLTSIQFDDVYHQGSPSGLLDYSYGFATGGTGSGSFLVDDVPGFSTILLHLASLSYFSMTPSSQLGFFQFDNVVLSQGVVPIPATLPLFASALAVLGWVVRRRKHSAID